MKHFLGINVSFQLLYNYLSKMTIQRVLTSILIVEFQLQMRPPLPHTVSALENALIHKYSHCFCCCYFELLELVFFWRLTNYFFFAPRKV